ncbi:MAG: hypothetical protein M3416_01630 [Acidobacteriota bacterium]|nr:hypothetical protein [Acidobacteriota bacterium]
MLLDRGLYDLGDERPGQPADLRVDSDGRGERAARTADRDLVVGAFVLGYFVLGLLTGHSYDERGYVREGESEIHLTSEVHAAGDWGPLKGASGRRSVMYVYQEMIPEPRSVGGDK